MDTDRKVVSKVRTTWQQYYPKNQCENSGKNLEDSNQYEIILNILKKTDNYLLLEQDEKVCFQIVE